MLVRQAHGKRGDVAYDLIQSNHTQHLLSYRELASLMPKITRSCKKGFVFMSFKVSLILSENWTMTSARDLRTLVDWAVIAEEEGVDSVMLSEHISLGPGADSEGRMANLRD